MCSAFFMSAGLCIIPILQHMEKSVILSIQSLDICKVHFILCVIRHSQRRSPTISGNVESTMAGGTVRACEPTAGSDSESGKEQNRT